MARFHFPAKIIPLLAGLSCTLLFAWTQFADVPFLNALTQRAESLVYDLRLNFSLPANRSPDSRIVIVDIDERSLGVEGHWPWPRDKIARLTEALFDAGAVVVGFDIFFSEAERNNAEQVLARVEQEDPENHVLIDQLSQLAPEFDNNRRLAEAFRDRDITLGYLFHEEDTQPVGELPEPLLRLSPEEAARSGIKSMGNYTASLPMLQEAAISSGFITTWPDRDGIIRRTPMLIRHGNEVYGSLSLNIAKLYLFLEDVKLHTAPIAGLDMMESIDLGGTKIPTDGYGFALVPYQGPAGSFPYISATDVLSGNGNLPALEGAIVLVGASAIGISDLVATPVENIYPGVEVHATMVRGILDNDFPYEPAWADGANLAATLVIGLLLTVILPFLGPATLLLVSALVGTGLIYGNFWIWQEQGMALDLAWPLLMIAALGTLNISYGFLSETRKRSQLKNMFGQYVPPQLVESMADSKESYGFEGESREMTVLFADIRGFTTLSEQLSPAELRTLLNRYFTHMTEIIFDYHGTIDKYVGDMIMAFWGAPLKDPDHAKHAIEAALQMLKKTHELKPVLAAEGYPEIDIGIGVNSGLMNVGDMGSSYRRAYTVLGDNVNLGSRIEGLTRFYGADLVVSEATMTGQEEYLFRRLDLVRVKGKTEAIKVFEPLCHRDEADTGLIDELQRHHRALEYYLHQQWDESHRLFAALNQEHPDTLIYQIYLQRISEIRRRNLGPDWDGVYERREK